MKNIINLFKNAYKFQEEKFKNMNELKSYLENEIDMRKSSLGGFSQSNFTTNNN